MQSKNNIISMTKFFKGFILVMYFLNFRRSSNENPFCFDNDEVNSIKDEIFEFTEPKIIQVRF
jgi:hypothetical protein